MGTIKVKFKDYLEARGLSAYRVTRHARGMSPKTVYAIASGRNRPSMDALEKLMDALREITGEDIGLDALIEYVPTPEGELDEEARAWLGDDLGGELPEYDWGEEGPPEVKPVKYEPGVGLVVDEEG
ncbi:MAG: helix-turn-helix domain-containing protein [Rubrobacteraceae bacterium]|jgi:transcriptional regulator with XRE-family HTH domain